MQSVKHYFIGNHTMLMVQKQKGLSYINHAELNKKKIFLLEKSKMKNGNTLALSVANFIETEGSKPMSIKWELNEPLPNYLWKEFEKCQLN
jgi:hypothetical protein